MRYKVTKDHELSLKTKRRPSNMEIWLPSTPRRPLSNPILSASSLDKHADAADQENVQSSGGSALTAVCTSRIAYHYQQQNLPAPLHLFGALAALIAALAYLKYLFSS